MAMNSDYLLQHLYSKVCYASDHRGASMARSKNIMFTDMMIKKLKAEINKYTRSEGNGFTVRIMPTGTKTWLYLFQFEGNRYELNLGSYPEMSLEVARSGFEDARKKLKNGINPLAEANALAEARRMAPTVSDLVDEFIERYSKRFKRSWEKDEGILKREAVAAWGRRKALDIKRRDVRLLLDSIIARNAPAMANNTLRALSKMFNWAVEQDILQVSPCLGVKLPAPKSSRSRALSEAEIRSVWSSLHRVDLNMSDEIRRALRLVLLTGQRPGEVIGMHSREIDGRWWTIPAERVKNKKSHRVYLTDLALKLIGRFGDDNFIFMSPIKSKNTCINENAMSLAVSRNLAYPLKDEHGNMIIENRLGVDKFTPHDLRRTAATFMAQSGEMEEVIDAVLNHSRQGIIKVYNQYKYDKEKQKALEVWEKKLITIIG